MWVTFVYTPNLYFSLLPTSVVLEAQILFQIICEKFNLDKDTVSWVVSATDLIEFIKIYDDYISTSEKPIPGKFVAL